jgi:predicted alpha-1,2-mannosidase
VDGAAQTVEYAYQDWCLAQLALELGNKEDYRLFLGRSRNYRNLYDDASGFMRPRNQDGSWLEPFDPLSLTGWCEANSWQYTWQVPHDIPDLIRLMGGPKAFVEKLEMGFAQGEAMDYYARKPELQRDRATINYGNEPGRYVAHLFNHAGAPWLSQKWSRRVLDRTFSSVSPMGYCEDDDQGKAAATSALLALGLFDLKGGAALRPVYELTAPVFDRIMIHLDRSYHPGDVFVMEARNNGPENVYIQSAQLNGAPLDRPWFHHRDLAAGARIDLVLGPAPSVEWGAGLENAPPSMTSDNESAPND